MSPRRPPSAGFTLVEVMIVTGILGTLLVLFGQTFTRSQGLHSLSRTHLKAEEDTRRSLAVLGRVLLGADLDSLVILRNGASTFDARTTPGPGDEIRFRRVDSWSLAGPVLGDEERLFWRTSGRAVDGVASAGEVVWAHDGVEDVLAPNVPSREALIDSNGDGDWDRATGERITDRNGNTNWDPGFAVTRVGGQIRLTLSTFATASDRTLVFATFDGTWTLRN
jgi:prepilin-type N-terminal cleavage/methylation domain-containing protein